MNSKQIVIGIVFVLIAIHLSGCIVDDAMIGTYRCDVVNDNGILYLTDGNQYEMLIDEEHGGGGAFGSYSVRENAVLLKMEFLGIIIPFDIDGRDLVDPDGDRWIRD